jgi:hypothetical protein
VSPATSHLPQLKCQLPCTGPFLKRNSTTLQPHVPLLQLCPYCSTSVQKHHFTRITAHAHHSAAAAAAAHLAHASLVPLPKGSSRPPVCHCRRPPPPITLDNRSSNSFGSAAKMTTQQESRNAEDCSNLILVLLLLLRLQLQQLARASSALRYCHWTGSCAGLTQQPARLPLPHTAAAPVPPGLTFKP